MREMGWRGFCKRRRVHTTVADSAATRAPDRVRRNFVAGAPGHGVYICGDCVTKYVAIVEGRPDRDTLPLRDREDYSDDELLDEVRRVAATTANVEADLRARVDELRQRGVAWSRIAAALGVTRQSAWERSTPD